MDDILNERHAKAAETFDRSVPLNAVAALLPGLRARFGITRLADVTGLDRIGIPVISAIVPNTADALSVYNGKGRTRLDATVGAVMESVERQVAAGFDRVDRELPVEEIRSYLDVDAFGLFESRRNDSLACARGFDLIRKGETFVPLALVRTPWDGAGTFPSTNTNGIAAGATLLDAVYHALHELAERHVWSMTHLAAHVIPRTLRNDAGEDSAIAQEIALPTGCECVDELAAAVDDAGFRLRVLALRESNLPVAIHASIIEDDARAVVHAFGIGISWSPAHAAVRAITEAAQSRVVDIQGARDDIRRREFRRDGLWYFNGPAKPIAFWELPERSCDDLAVELRMLVDALEEIGVRTIAVVDLTPPDLPVRVVRVVSPEIESYFVDRRVGPIARAKFTKIFEQLKSRMSAFVR